MRNLIKRLLGNISKGSGWWEAVDKWVIEVQVGHIYFVVQIRCNFDYQYNYTFQAGQSSGTTRWTAESGDLKWEITVRQCPLFRWCPWRHQGTAFLFERSREVRWGRSWWGCWRPSMPSWSSPTCQSSRTGGGQLPGEDSHGWKGNENVSMILL